MNGIVQYPVEDSSGALLQEVEGFLTEKGFSLAVKGLIGNVILLLEIKISDACRSFSW